MYDGALFPNEQLFARFERPRRTGRRAPPTVNCARQGVLSGGQSPKAPAPFYCTQNARTLLTSLSGLQAATTVASPDARRKDHDGNLCGTCHPPWGSPTHPTREARLRRRRAARKPPNALAERLGHSGCATGCDVLHIGMEREFTVNQERRSPRIRCRRTTKSWRLAIPFRGNLR